MRKRILSLCAALALCLSLLPLPVLALEPPEEILLGEREEPPEAMPTEEVPEATLMEAPDVAETSETMQAELFGAVPDDNDLLMYYLEQEGGALPEALLMAEAGDRLTGLEAAVYKALKAAVKEIAAGQRQSTEISLDLRTLGYPNTKSFSNETYRKIANALFADCPYDFYWFGRLYSYSARSSGGNIVSLTCKFSVSQYYAAGEYQVRSDLSSLLSTVLNNTSKIVNKYAEKSDYEKLKAYKDEICDWVDYDYDAASYGNSQQNSNPYQLIFVFDGKASTKVVCEGYAKAFQFLCDLSSFDDSNFACYHVKGMAGGRHSWNHVTLDGQTYLVDVTNCDTGTVGYPDGLFMKHALTGANTRTTGYTIPISDTTSKTYTDIDYYQFSRTNNQSDENFYDKNAPFLTLATTPYQPTNVHTYKVTIIDGTGSGEYSEGDTVNISANAAPDGCDIWGWWGPSAVRLTFIKDSPIQQAFFTMPASQVTFRATYSYPVTFDPNGGTLSEAKSSKELRFTKDKYHVDTYSEYGGTLPTPTREGYTFDGWYTAKTGGTKVADNDTPSTLSAHTLYAHWTKPDVAPKYTVTIIDGTGSGEYEEGETVTISANPAPAGCVIKSWYGPTNVPFDWVKNSPTKEVSFKMPGYNVTYRAIYAYTVTFDPNGGTLPETETTRELRFTTDGKTFVHTYGKSGALPIPVRNGYEFLGWYTEANTKITADTTPSTLTAHTLYAHWQSLAPAPKIAAGNANALQGANVEIPVTIQNNPGISGAALTVSYDKSAFTLNGIQKGAVFATGTYTAYPDTGVVSWYSTENVTTDGTLFTLQLTVNGTASAGTYPVTIGLREGKAANLTNADSQSVSAEFVSGTLEVAPGVLGDVTGDNDVAMNDVVKVARAVAKKITLTSAEKVLADVTGDGVVAINDVVKLARYVAGNIASLQTVSLSAEAASAVIETATVSGNPGGTVRVPVSITENPGIAGAQLDILFNDALTLKNVIRGEVMSAGTFEPDISAKSIQWYYDQANVTDTGILFTLEFEISAEGETGTEYAVTVNVSDGITANLSDYDSNPVSATFKAGKIQVGEPATGTAVNSVSRNGTTVTTEIVCDNSGATVFCVAYSDSGKMLAVRSAQVTGKSAYQFEFDGQEFDYAKVLLLDGNSVPLCDPGTTT